jgi:hypothetical protein
MRGVLGALALLLVLGCASLPPVALVDAQRREALVNADVAALRALFADGLRYGHANGVVETKAELLEGLGSGRLDYRAIRVEDSETREVGGAWVVTGRQTIDVTSDGRELTSHSVFTAVYTQSGGRWQLVAYQSTPLPPPH